MANNSTTIFYTHYVNNLNYFSKNIEFLLFKNRISHAKVATSLGIGRTTVTGYVTGHSQPNIKGLYKIAEFLDISVSDLLEKDLSNAHLIVKKENDKKQENAHPISHLTAHLIDKKEVKYPPEHTDSPAFNYSLNEDQMPYKVIEAQLLSLSSKMAQIEANTTKSLAKIEDKIKGLAKGKSKM